MSTTTTARRVHRHGLGLSIIRMQLADGDTMIEGESGQKIVRMRTELQQPVPLTRPRLSAIEVAVALAEQATAELYVIRPSTVPIPRRSIEPSTARIIAALPNRHRPVGVR